MIDGKPLWWFTRVMSIRDLRPWELEYAPVGVMNLFFAAVEAHASGRRRADREQGQRETADQQRQEAEGAAQRQADRMTRFEEIEAQLAAQRGEA